MKTKTVVSQSVAQTLKIGAQISKLIEKYPCVILLNGPMGAGKTQLAQGLIHQLIGKKTVVLSPTYSIVNAYKKGQKSIFHVDLYRLRDTDDLESIGFWDFFDGPNVIVVEWGEKLKTLWPPETHLIQIDIRVISDSQREFVLSQPSLMGS